MVVFHQPHGEKVLCLTAKGHTESYSECVLNA